MIARVYEGGKARKTEAGWYPVYVMVGVALSFRCWEWHRQKGWSTTVQWSQKALGTLFGDWVVTRGQ